MCSLKESALLKVTPRFLTEDLMGKMEGLSCKVGVCKRKLSVRDGEPVSTISVFLWFSLLSLKIASQKFYCNQFVEFQ